MNRLLLLGLAAGAALPFAARAQVVITSKDMFNQIGEYYLMYKNTTGTPISVTPDILGNTGGPQSWDFTAGPQDDTNRFDYVAVNADGHGSDFAAAKFAERKTASSDGSQSWLFLDQAFGAGRMDYGFYDTTFNPDFPSNPFKPPIVDFPDPIALNQTWSVSTTFTSQLIGIPMIINYTASATADAYGVINLPGIGFGDCLRVNELAEYDSQADINGDGTYQTVSTDYIRTYYWLRPDHGIVAQISSQQQSAPPPNNFTSAAEFDRMFQLYHPVSTNPPVTGATVKITYGNGKVLLSWTKGGNASSFTVQSTTNIATTNAWNAVTNTTNNFLLDPIVPTNKTVFYRILSNSSP